MVNHNGLLKKFCLKREKNYLAAWNINVRIYQPLHTSRMQHKVNFFADFTGLNVEFSFSKTGSLSKTKELSLPYYFNHCSWESSWIPNFSRMLVLFEIQIDLFRIWWPSWLGRQNTSTASWQRGKTHPGYDTKKPQGEAPVMQELWGIESTPLLPSLSVPLWTRLVAPDRVLSVGQIELFNI